MDLDIIRGDSKSFVMVLTDDVGAPINLTGATVWMTAKAAFTDADAAAAFQKTSADGINVISAANGLISVALQPADTDELAGIKHRLVYDVQVENDDGVRTVARGRFTVYPDVTIVTNES